MIAKLILGPGYYEVPSNYALSDNTHKLLVRYGWENRFMKASMDMPQEIFDSVMSRVNEAFTGSFSWRGEIPFLTYANVWGLAEHIKKSDDDSVIGIVAPPGRGKSTLTLSVGRFLDPSYENDMTIFTIEQFRSFLKKATRIFNQIQEAREKGVQYFNPLAGKTVILDEGVYLLFSGDAASKNGKLLQKLFSIIRALGLIFLVNITNWRKISQGVKEDRFAAIIRIPVKGYVEFYSKSRVAKIEIDKNKVKFPKPNFTERVGFIGHDCQFWTDYMQKKSQFLIDATHME